MAVTRGANGLISSGVSMASAMTSRIVVRASLACESAPARTCDGMPSELRVQLQGRDEVLGACDLEVHVAEGVFGTEDVGQSDVTGFTVDLVGDQTHGDTGNRSAKRHTGVEQSERGRAHRAHRGGTVGAQSLGDLANRVRELFDAGQNRHESALGECTVTDFATLRRTDAARLTGGVRREVVMMHVALGGLGTERVDLLSHLDHVESGHTQDLGLATLEQCGAVCARDDRDLGGQRTDVRDAAAVDAELIAQDALANQLLGERAERCSQFLLAAFEVGCNLLENLDLDLVGLVRRVPACRRLSVRH